MAIACRAEPVFDVAKGLGNAAGPRWLGSFIYAGGPASRPHQLPQFHKTFA
jgi:hypothetical protein